MSRHNTPGRGACAALVVSLLAALGPRAASAAGDLRETAAQIIGAQQDRLVLRIRNRTPYILILYVSGVRVGWIKPFRSEAVRGLKEGYHKVYATSRYGSGYFGPRKAWVPGNWSITPSAGGLSGDVGTALVSRIYRSNRASLAACDRLARRRGEQLSGQRAELEIRVDPEGQGAVTIRGEHVSDRLRSCYEAVSTRWSLPKTGEPYTVSFQHIHDYR